MSGPQASVRDIVLLSDDALDTLRTHLLKQGQLWQQAWCQWSSSDQDACPIELTVQRVGDAQAGVLPDVADWHSVDGASGLWCQVEEASVQAFARRLVRRSSGPFPNEADWAMSAARAALFDLPVRWAAGEVAGDAEERVAVVSLDDALHPAFGGVLVFAPALGAHWLLTPAFYGGWLPTMARRMPSPAVIPAVPWAHALSPCTLQLELGIGHVDIAVTDLMELRVGDVVRFPAQLKEPLPLLAARAGGQREELMRGRLGHRDGHLTVQVVSRGRSA